MGQARHLHLVLYERAFWCAILAALPIWYLLSFWLPLRPLQWQQTDILGLFSVVLFYPILEEVVFRGGLQGWLVRSGGDKGYRGISAANVFVSLIFALLHFVVQESSFALLVFFPSIVFGYFRDRHGNIIASILLHIFYNLGFNLLYG